jgi:hypothetical protein
LPTANYELQVAYCILQLNLYPQILRLDVVEAFVRLLELVIHLSYFFQALLEEDSLV